MKTRYAWRLFRRHLGRMIFLSMCIGIGTGGLFVVGVLLDAVNSQVAGRARQLLTGDIVISSWRQLAKPLERELRSKMQPNYAVTEIIQFASMAQPKQGAPFLVAVKAITPAYPFYGTLVIEPANYRDRFFKQASCLLSKQEAERRGLKVGDSLVVGDMTFTLAGLIVREPDQLVPGALMFAPRFIIAHDQVTKTGLIRFGSRVNYSLVFAALAALADPAKNLTKANVMGDKEDLEKMINDPHVKVRSYLESQPSIESIMTRLQTFFTLISLVTLLLGAIGMVVSLSAFLSEQIETVSLFRTLGMSRQEVAAIYRFLCLTIGFIGGVLGVAWGALALYGMHRLLGNTIEMNFHYLTIGLRVVECVTIACVVAVGLNRAAIQSLVNLSPVLAMRTQGIQLPISRRGLIYSIGATLLFLFTYSAVVSNSMLMAAQFVGGLGVLLFVAAFIIKGALGTLARLQPKSSSLLFFSIRHGLRQLVRQRLRSMTYLLALGIGFSLIACLMLVYMSFVEDLRLAQSDDLPSIFLVDVQTDQRAGVAKLLAQFTKTTRTFTPLIRARLTHINAHLIDPVALRKGSEEEKTKARFLTREYNLTYKKQLNDAERIVAGGFWKPDSQQPQISLEKRFAERLGVDLGHALTFDVQGRAITAVVTSIRVVRWLSLLPNFFVVMPPVLLASAPQTLIAAARIDDRQQLVSFQKQLLRLYPNVSVVDINAMIVKTTTLLSYLVTALELIAWICILTGTMILVGAIATGRADRRVHLSLLTVLGSVRKRILLTECVEFMAIGLVTTIVVAVISFPAAYGLCAVMDIRLRVPLDWASSYFTIILALPLFSAFFVNFPLYFGRFRNH